MEIAIIGTGQMATSLTKTLGKANQITVYGRDEEEAKNLAEENGAAGEKLGDSIPQDLVILALPYSAISSFLQENGKLLEGKILIDISNAMDWQKMELLEGEGVLKSAESLPANTKIIKAFNTIPAPILAEGQVDGKPVDVFLAGDDQDAKDKLAEAINASGLRAIDVGALSHAPYLESLLLINSLAGMKVGGGKPVSTKILQ